MVLHAVVSGPMSARSSPSWAYVAVKILLLLLYKIYDKIL